MPVYLFNCPNCGEHDEFAKEPKATATCPTCGQPSKRRYSFRQSGTSFQPHFNYAVGQYVHTDKEFREALKRGGDAAGTTYTPHYPGDIPEPTKDTDILETQARTWHDKQAKGEAVVDQGLVIKP